MRRRGRGWRITMWTALAIAFASTAAAVTTRQWIGPFATRGFCNVRGWMFGVEAGTVFVGYFPTTLNGFWRLGCRASHSSWLWYKDYTGSSFARGWDIGMSLWIPATAAISVAGIAFWRSRQSRFDIGECLSCGYNRTGLAVAAPCPECGKREK